MTPSYQKNPRASDENEAESKEIREPMAPKANAAMLESTASERNVKTLIRFPPK